MLFQKILGFLRFFVRLNKFWKRLILVALDVCLCIGAFVVSFYLRVGEYQSPIEHLPYDGDRFFWQASVLAILSLGISGAYDFRVRLWSREAFLACFKGSLFLGIALTAVLLIDDLYLPRSIGIIFSVVFLIMVLLSRLLIRRLLREQIGKYPVNIWVSGPVAIVGLTDISRSIARFLRSQGIVKIYYVDTAVSRSGYGLRKDMVDGIRVLGLVDLEELTESVGLHTLLYDEVSLNEPYLSKLREKCYANNIGICPVLEAVKPWPLGAINTLDLSSIFPERHRTVDYYGGFLGDVGQAHTVVVTGAGGSIGSEVVSQLAQCQSPINIVAIDHNEFSLFDLSRKLRTLQTGNKVALKLLTVVNTKAVAELFSGLSDFCVIHAAAYKHVNLVDQNRISAYENNVIGTRNVATLAAKNGCERFILVSTDKAVKPTTVMGATKRLSELDLAEICKSTGMRGAIVRFGNVSKSSGSVIPIFSSQIAQRGPVTVTDAFATRYLMSISQACRLILELTFRSDLRLDARDTSIYVLDMGQPIEIHDLAKRMINASGLRLGDQIKIEYVGLGSTEKLHEELLSDGDAVIETVVAGVLEITRAAVNPDLRNSLEQLIRSQASF